MAVFRVEKNHNYTVMSNYHLRDTALTLKAIGLLSKMLSLTDEWDYTTRGLAAICKEGVDAIGATVLTNMAKDTKDSGVESVAASPNSGTEDTEDPKAEIAAAVNAYKMMKNGGKK